MARTKDMSCSSRACCAMVSPRTADWGAEVKLGAETLHPPQEGEGRIACSEAECEPGWGDPSTRTPFEWRDCHPTPPLISFASTLPLQGRVRSHTDAVVTPPSTTMVWPVMKVEASDARYATAPAI